MFEPSFSMLESIGCQDTARNLTTYEKIRPEIDPISIKDINPFKTVSKVQEATNILRVVFALSK